MADPTHPSDRNLYTPPDAWLQGADLALDQDPNEEETQQEDTSDAPTEVLQRHEGPDCTESDLTAAAAGLHGVDGSTWQAKAEPWDHDGSYFDLFTVEDEGGDVDPGTGPAEAPVYHRVACWLLSTEMDTVMWSLVLALSVAAVGLWLTG